MISACYSERAKRKPILPLRILGIQSARDEERQFPSTEAQQPPRTT